MQTLVPRSFCVCVFFFYRLSSEWAVLMIAVCRPLTVDKKETHFGSLLMSKELLPSIEWGQVILSCDAVPFSCLKITLSDEFKRKIKHHSDEADIEELWRAKVMNQNIFNGTKFRFDSVQSVQEKTGHPTVLLVRTSVILRRLRALQFLCSSCEESRPHRLQKLHRNQSLRTLEAASNFRSKLPREPSWEWCDCRDFRWDDCSIEA